MILNLSLENAALYEGCDIEEVAGRRNLTTPVPEAIQLVGRNISRLVAQVPAAERGVCVLTGGMAIWAYLVVFHAVVHAFREIQYDDGRTGPVVIARHG